MAYKTITRDIDHKVIGGVCAGLGNYFESDPILFRILFLILTIIGGSGVLLYIVMWIMLPKKKDHRDNLKTDDNVSHIAQTDVNESSNNKIFSHAIISVVGIVVICFGLLLLLDNFIDIDEAIFFPIGIIIIGILIVMSPLFKPKQEQSEEVHVDYEEVHEKEDNNIQI